MREALQPVFSQSTRQLRIVMLGVTPELTQLPWPPQVALLAFDHSPEMIHRVWQPNASIKSSAQLADWCALPVQSKSIDAIVGDGALTTLPNLRAYMPVLMELRRVLKPDGLLVIRAFVRPDQTEALDSIVLAANSSLIGSFHALKWRIAMSLAELEGGVVSTAQIYEKFNQCFPCRKRLSEVSGWSESVIDTINAYQATTTQYNFPTLAQLRQACSPYFAVDSISFANYELSDRCPTITLRLCNEALTGI